MPPEHFQELLSWLAQNFQLLLFGERGKSDKPGVVLSFDDGYTDFIEYAMPLLHRFGIGVNQNIIPECVDSGLPIWNVRLYDFLKAAPRSVINSLVISGFDRKLMGDDDLSKLSYGLALSRFLKNRPRAEREPLLVSVEAAITALGDYPRTRMMSVEQVRQAAEHHQIGVHSYSHDSMGYETDDHFAADTDRCLTFFRDRLRLPLDTYAFPNGSYRPSQVELLRQRGFRNILLVDERYPECRGADVYTRVTLSGESTRELHLQALGYRAGA